MDDAKTFAEEILCEPFTPEEVDKFAEMLDAMVFCNSSGFDILFAWAEHRYKEETSDDAYSPAQLAEQAIFRHYANLLRDEIRTFASRLKALQESKWKDAEAAGAACSTTFPN
jgi:hypothetical protein